MADLESTCWTLIRGASAGLADDREEFAHRYAPVVRAYLAARWRESPLRQEIDDATQEVFAECLRAGGPLDRADRDRGDGFRPFLYGVARNVALRIEADRARERARRPPGAPDLDGLAAPGDHLSHAFDRAWAKSLMRQAAERQAEAAAKSGEPAIRRVELLRLRFHDGLPIREIARRWAADPAALHREYARARDEFRAALREVVAFHHPGATPAEVERHCASLIAMLA